MKILLIHHSLPFPLRSGMDKVTYNLLRSLKEAHQTTLVVPVLPGTDPQAVEQTRACCTKLVLAEIPGSRSAGGAWLSLQRWAQLALGRVPPVQFDNHYPQLGAAIRKELGSQSYQLVQAVSLAAAQYLNQAGPVPTSILFHDNLFQQRKDYLLNSRSRLAQVKRWLEYRAYLSYEPAVFCRADFRLFLSSENLAQMLETARGVCAGEPWARHLPLAVEEQDPPPAVSAPADEEPGSLVFVGGLGPQFNQDAVFYFVQQIFPLILKEVPQASFTIVGENPPPAIQKLADSPNIRVTGRVASVSPYLRRSQVYVAPLRFGGGIKTKMVEALGHAKAIVATPAALSGLWDLDAEALAVAPTAEQFAAQVLNLLADAERRKRMEAAALALYHRSYAYPAVLPKTLAVYAEIEQKAGQKT